MLEAVNDVIVNLMDYPLGWILSLPRDLMLLAVAVLTSLVLTLARRWSTDQDWLKRADADRKRLGELLRQARRAGDKEAVKRHRGTATLIKVRALRYEFKPLLWAIVPVALVATWAFSRLAYLPPRPGDVITVRAYLPASAIGRLAHLVPPEHVRAEDGWVRPVVRDALPPPGSWWDRVNRRIRSFLKMDPPLEGVAVWRLVVLEPGREVLNLRYAGSTCAKEVLVGSRRYAAPVAVYPGSPVQAVEVVMEPVKLFGLVGGIDWLYLPPWLVAYLLLAIPLVSVLKRLLRVY